MYEKSLDSSVQALKTDFFVGVLLNSSIERTILRKESCWELCASMFKLR